jgi:hypothetical protein
MEVLVSLYSDHMVLLRECLLGIGFNQQQLLILGSLQNTAVQMLSASKDISELFNLFNSFKKKTVLLTTYLEAQIVSSILSKNETFDSRSLAKINLALLIKDVLLSEEDFNSLNVSNGEVKGVALTHGMLLFDKICSGGDLEFKNDLISNLLLNHHENPDGSGFPNGIDFTRFDLPLAVYFLVNQFVDLMVSQELKQHLNKDCANQVLKNNLKYASSSNFCKALELFSSTILNKEVYFE